MSKELPVVSAPVANFVHYVIVGNLVFISGQLPFENNEIKFKGKVGEAFTPEQGAQAAELCARYILAQLKVAIQDFSKVKKCIKVSGFVNASPDFTEHSKVINGASDFIVGYFEGDIGKHTREAVGVSSLPLGAAVEVGAIFEIV